MERDDPVTPSVSQEPTWPAQRGLKRYDALLGIDLGRMLEAGGLWIEIGPGTEALPMLPFLRRPGVELEAIGPHSRALPDGIAFTQGIVPEDEVFFAAHRGRARLVTDVFGALSYYDDPIRALLYGALLLADGGLFLGFTELYRFGDLSTWEKTTEFFRQTLNQRISFETIPVLGDATKKYATGLRVRVQGPAAVNTPLGDIFEEAARQIGRPAHTSTLWAADDCSASISRVDYQAGSS